MHSMECQGVLETTSESEEIINADWGAIVSHKRLDTSHVYMYMYVHPYIINMLTHAIYDSLCNTLDVLINVTHVTWNIKFR